MTVSVVIPLYNKARHIQRAVSSVLRQTYQDFELIVVDDGSTDGSADLVREVADSRVRVVVQANAGASAARNRGIQEASHELVAFLDADDEWLPVFLEEVTDLRAKHPEAGMYATAYVCCDGYKINRPRFFACTTQPHGGLLEDYFRSAFGPPPITSSSVMIPKSAISEVGLFPVGIALGEDLCVWTAIALRYRVAWTPVDGAIYHLSTDNRACRSSRPEPDWAVAAVIQEYLNSSYESVSARVFVSEYLISLRLRLAWAFLLQGEKGLALDLLGKTRGTVLFRARRLSLRLIAQLPRDLLLLVLRLKVSFRRLGC